MAMRAGKDLRGLAGLAASSGKDGDGNKKENIGMILAGQSIGLFGFCTF
jgi:hypothetical protein